MLWFSSVEKSYLWFCPRPTAATAAAATARGSSRVAAVPLLVVVLSWMILFLQQAFVVTPLVLLTPPASHYDFYDETRSELFDFYADFSRAASSVGERAVFVTVDEPPIDGIDLGSFQELLARGVPEDDLLLQPNNISLDDIWVRDFFPTQISNATVARFSFSPAYLDNETVTYINWSTEDILAFWDVPGLTYLDDIVMDGGGIVFISADDYYTDDDVQDNSNSTVTTMAVVTDRVLRDNPHLAGREGVLGAGPADTCCPDDPYDILTGDPNGQFTREEIALGEQALQEALGFDVVAIVPEEPEVPRLGHIDGIVGFLSPTVVALSNYSDPALYGEYKAKLLETFGEDKITVVPLPYAVVNETYSDGFESAEGIYVNFLRTKHAIYMPIFDIPQDELALQIARRYSDLPVVPVNASQVAIMGGSVRCLSQHLWGENALAIAEPLMEVMMESSNSTQDEGANDTTTMILK